MSGARNLPNVLSEREDKFVELVAGGMKHELAYEVSGYREDQGAASNLASTPRIARAIEWRMRSALRTRIAPKALKILETIADDETISPKLRAAVAKDLIEKAGIIAPRAAVQEQSQKTLAEMSPGELADIVSKLETELAGRAKDVSAPNAPVSDSEVSDMLS